MYLRVGMHDPAFSVSDIVNCVGENRLRNGHVENRDDGITVDQRDLSLPTSH